MSTQFILAQFFTSLFVESKEKIFNKEKNMFIIIYLRITNI